MKLIDVDNAEVEVEDSWPNVVTRMFNATTSQTGLQLVVMTAWLTKRSSFIIGLKKSKKSSLQVG